MRLFPVLLVLLIASLPGSVSAQGYTGDSSSPDELAVPPPPVDEYNNVPPGLLMSEDSPPPDTSVAEEGSSQEDIMTMSDLVAAYNRGQYNLVAKHIIPIANGNYPEAEELLGIMYNKGQGLEKDPQSALEWLTKAAEADRPLAQHYLATMSYTGDGEPVDQVTALMWLYIAIVHYADGPDKDRAIQDRDNLSQQMSRRDRLRSFELAHDWLKKRDESALLANSPPP